MPVILVKDYTWRQTEDTIIINAPIVGHPKKIDLFTSKNYIKASYPPFILELFLWGHIIDEDSKCTLSEELVVFSLKKAETGLEWPHLVQNLDRQTKKTIRAQILERAHLTARERAKAKSEIRQKLQKRAVRAQIDLDTSTLNKIDAMRDSARKEAMLDFEDWRSNAEEPILRGVQGKMQENRKAFRPPFKWFKDERGEVQSKVMTTEEVFQNDSITREKNTASLPELKWKQTEINDSGDLASINNKTAFEVEENELKPKYVMPGSDNNKHSCSCSEDSESDSQDTNGLSKFCEKKTKDCSKVVKMMLKRRPVKINGIFDELKQAVPLPRNTGSISVKFSERVFPTPARESHHIEEQEWIEKQAEARRKTGFVAEDLRPEEQDPQWLKDKGDEFFKAGNYLGAVSAYTHGIKLSEKFAALHANRAAAHYALGNYQRCAEDSSKAIELMVPLCSTNAEARAKCHARMGAALCKLGSPQHGIPELEAALRLAPGNLTVERDLEAAKLYFNIGE